MKNRFTILLQVLLFLPFSYCSRTNSKSHNLNTIDISLMNFQKGETKLSEIASSIDYVFFVSRKESLFASLNKIKISKNYILIYDDVLNKLLLFDRQGDFLREISRSGKGPGEYVSITDYTINESINRIIINSGFQRKLIFLTIQGQFIREESTKLLVHYLADFGNSIALGTHFPTQHYIDNFNIHIVDTAGKVLSKDLYRPIKSYNKKAEIAFNSNYFYYDTLSVWDGYFDTIYGVTGNLKVTPRWLIKNSNNYIGFNGFFDGQTDFLFQTGKYYIGKVLESENYFFIDYSKDHVFHTLLFSKETGKVKDCVTDNPSYNHGSGFVNDLDGGYPFWPIGNIDEKTIFTFVNVFNIKEYFESNAKNKQINSNRRDSLMHALKSMTDLDNPILIIVNLK